MQFRSIVILLFSLACAEIIVAQSFNHWTRSFNEESSLLSGAVVGGGAWPSAIYYNPASISEITASKISFHASLFSYRIYDIKNALGDGNHLNWSSLQIEPRFLSYMIKPKNHPEWSLELAFLNNENHRLDVAQSLDRRIDILKQIPGEERYFATFQYLNRYRDDWIGIGWSWRLSQRLSIGASMFITIKTHEYHYKLNIEAYPIDTSQGMAIEDFYSASYQDVEYLKYNDYRLLWKIGLLHKWDRLSLGICLTTPSVGGIYSDGKRVSRIRNQTNITDPENGAFMPDYYIGDYKEKNEVTVNHKTPISCAAGLTWHSKNRNQIFYSTIEYFGDIEAYKIVEAHEGADIATGSVTANIEMNEWLTFVSGARPVLNAALGYSWTINEKLLLMAGIRSDFNYIKDFNYKHYEETQAMKNLAVDNYHISGGLSWNIIGQDIITGLQYTIGRETDQEQIINLSDPVEYNIEEQSPLQGARQNNVSSLINSLSIYVGATFNFGEKN
ncbi:MAG: hypothetical protein ABFS05_12365 [Bacteroidota bacterium]